MPKPMRFLAALALLAAGLPLFADSTSSIFIEPSLDFTLTTKVYGTREYNEIDECILDMKSGKSKIDYEFDSHIYIDDLLSGNENRIFKAGDYRPWEKNQDTGELQRKPVPRNRDLEGLQSLSWESKISSTDKDTDAFSIRLKLDIKGEENLAKRGRCSNVLSDTFRWPEKAFLRGKMSVSIRVPDTVHLLKITPSNLGSVGVFGLSKISEVRGSVQGVFPIGEDYLWLRFDEEAKEDNRVVQIIFDFEGSNGERAEVIPTTRSGMSLESNFGFTVKRLHLLENQNYLSLLEAVADQISTGKVGNELLMLGLATLLYRSQEVSNSVANTPNEKLSQISQAFFDYSLKSTKGGSGINPTLKTMTTLMSTLLSRTMAQRLLPHCTAIVQTIPVIERDLEAPRFLFTIFWMNRLTQRLLDFDISKILKVIDLFESLDKIPKDDPKWEEVFTTASKEFEEYQYLQGRAGKPFLTAQGEFMRFLELSDIPTDDAFFTVTIDSISANLKTSRDLEDQLLKGIADLARATMGYPGVKKPSVRSLKSKRQQLSKIKLSLIQDLGLVAQKVFQSPLRELSFENQYNQLFSAFEGLASVNLWADVDPQTTLYVSRAFVAFLDSNERVEIENYVRQAKQCMSGGIR